MIDWDAQDWGGHVHESETGSWLRGSHGEEQERYGFDYTIGWDLA